DQSWVRQDGVAQGGVRHPGGHCYLDGSHDLGCACTKGGEAEDFVGFCADESFQEAARFGHGRGAHHRFHRNLEKAVWNVLSLRFLFAETVTSELWIDKQTKRDFSSGGDTIAAGDARVDNAEVVDADMREHGAARDFADGPDTGCGCGE